MLWFASATVHAQDPRPRGALALASGNTDSLSYNFALDLAYGTTTGNMLRWTGLYLRGTRNDVVVNRLSVGLRDEYTFSPRVFAFGRIDYLHDTFKRIDYFISPAVGLGYKVIDTPTTRFSIDLGSGSVTERNLEDVARTTGAIQAGETLVHDLNSSASIKHAITTVWNSNDLGSGLITTSVGIATRQDRVKAGIALNRHDVVGAEAAEGWPQRGQCRIVSRSRECSGGSLDPPLNTTRIGISLYSSGERKRIVCPSG